MEKNIKWYLIVLIVLLLFITACFLNEEYSNLLHFNEKINHEKLSSYFISVGALITAFSLTLIYLQFNESKKQNDFSIQPKLFIENKTYYLKEQGETSFTKSYITIKEQDVFSKDDWGIKVLNIGNGTALKIEAEWLFDFIEVKSITEKYYRSTLEMIKLKFSKDYLRTDETIFIGLPWVYLNLFGDKLHSQPQFNKQIIDFEKKPVLKVKLKYYDIQNIGYESQFNVTTISDTSFLSFSFDQEYVQIRSTVVSNNL